MYDDALLLRLARQAKYGRLRGEVSHLGDNQIGNQVDGFIFLGNLFVPDGQMAKMRSQREYGTR